MNTTETRIVFLDYLRLIACFMVMLVHSCEPFYLGGAGTQILSYEDGLWATLIDSAIRASVPLFVMASSYLLFPLKTDSRTFFVKRFRRVVIPFVLWMILYAVVPLYGNIYAFYSADHTIDNLVHVLYNFVGEAGHLWFVFMLLGIYLVMPLLSPWVRQASRRTEECFLLVWLGTTLVPFLRYAAACHSGLPQIWGEANWNEFGMLYGVSGFIGYVVLGHYLRTYHSEMPLLRSLLIALPCLVVGYAISALGFWYQMPKDFPVQGSIDIAVQMELTWGFCSTGVVLMSLGYFLLIRHLTWEGCLYRWLVKPISHASYGMYLMHIFFLCFFYQWIHGMALPPLPTILLTATFTYVASFVLSATLQRIPWIGKYLVG